MNVIDFDNENEFNKKLRGLKKHCILAYKDLIFNKQELLKNMNDGYYVVDLETSYEFRFIYGQIKVVFSVNNNILTLKDLEPSSFLIDAYKQELLSYKGQYIRNKQDMFKVDFLMYLKEKKKIRKGLIC